jgi:hypothetical protein
LGFIIDENGPSALVELPDEHSIILREGEKIRELRVQKISQDSIIIKRGKLQFTFFLSGE